MRETEEDRVVLRQLLRLKQASVCPAIALAIAVLLCSAWSSSEAAGVSTTSLPSTSSEAGMEVLVWTPCKSTPSDVPMGPYVIRAIRGCQIEGQSLPLIVISHGQGGTRLSHHDTATALADAGFVVASFNHPGDSYGDEEATDQIGVFHSRPRHVSRVISYMTETWTDRRRIDAQAVGVFGFSRGGYTALVLGGAVPSASAAASRFCGFWRSLFTPVCGQLSANSLGLISQTDSRVKAVVAADALNLFEGSSFRTVKIPIQLWASELGGAGVRQEHTELLQKWVPQAGPMGLAKGAGHFAFLAPCSEELRQEASTICEDPAGFDRQKWHGAMNQAVATFFRSAFRTATPLR
jgi:predicted dienelactone hydrolase